MKTVIALVDDLFFASKLRGTAEHVGVQIQFVKSIPAAIEKARNESPHLIIADLNASCCDAVELARALKGDDSLSGVPLLGFFSHVQIELQQAAIAAGYDRVMPRSAFTINLAEILAGTDLAKRVFSVSLCMLSVSVVNSSEQMLTTKAQRTHRDTKKCETRI